MAKSPPASSTSCTTMSGTLACTIMLGDGAPLSPAPSVYGNFSLMGVCLAYTPDPIAMRAATGMNLPTRAHGLDAHEKILALIREGKMRTVVTSEVPFEHLPQAMERQERRETMGRTVVRVAPESGR